MEKYLNQVPLSEEEIVHRLRVRAVAGEIQPMLCGSAFRNRGAAHAGCGDRADALAARRACRWKATANMMKSSPTPPTTTKNSRRWRSS
ncbi:hypothetical protein M8494_09805 [Serratia ureilytica]